MFKNIFQKQKSLDLINTHEADVALRLMFEIAISDGSLDKAELELIKKRARRSSNTDEKVSKIIKKVIDESDDSFSFYQSVKEINDTHSL